VSKKRIVRKKGPVVAKRVIHDGIQFASGLEKHMYIRLKENNIRTIYEGETFTLIEPFMFNEDCYERQSNGKGILKNTGGKKIQSMKYTPDFIGEGFIIECKGRANESFPLRWKLFKKYVSENLKGVTLYKPQNKKECDEVVELIKKQRNGFRN